MATDPCSYMNPMATTAACIASGGKPSADPCNILNPLGSKSACATNQAANAVAKSGMPDWLKAVIAIAGLLVFFIGAYIMLSFAGMGASGGGRRGGGRGGSRR